MAKFNIAYVKQHPVMFGAIVVVFGLLFWLLINRGSGSGGSGGVSINNSGPTDAQVQAGTALQMAQIQANTQLNMAQLSMGAKAAEIEGHKSLAALEMQIRLAELGASKELGTLQVESSLAALMAQLGNQEAINASNNAFMLDYATATYDAATTQVAINAALQRDLGAQQLEGFKFSGLMSSIGSLKKKDRDDTLERIFGNPEAMAYNPNSNHMGGGGGGFSLGSISPVAGFIGL